MNPLVNCRQWQTGMLIPVTTFSWTALQHIILFQ